MNRSHLYSLMDRKRVEQLRVDNATTSGERELRTAWVAQFEKEIAAELKFLGIEPEAVAAEISDEELLRELGL